MGVNVVLRRKNTSTTSENCFSVETLFITAYTCADLNVIIPDNVNGQNIRGIGDSAFSGKSLNSVQIPSSVNWIGHEAFSHNHLKSIQIPSATIEISEDAFSDNELTSVVIPGGVSEIDSHAFYNNKLGSVQFMPHSGLGSLTLGDCAFCANPLSSVQLSLGDPTYESAAFDDTVLINGKAYLRDTQMCLFPNEKGLLVGQRCDQKDSSTYLGNPVADICDEYAKNIGGEFPQSLVMACSEVIYNNTYDPNAINECGGYAPYTTNCLEAIKNKTYTQDEIKSCVAVFQKAYQNPYNLDNSKYYWVEAQAALNDCLKTKGSSLTTQK